MNSTLLVLLASELIAPFHAEFARVVPEAFPGAQVEVGTGTHAPPGRNVAWVAPLGSQEVEVVLHTSRVAGDLRRVLRFAPQESARERARAAAFTLASMLRERESDLRANEPPPVAPPPAPPPVAVASPSWLVDGSLLGGIDIGTGGSGGGGNPGAGFGARVRRQVLSWLHAGAGTELGVFATPGSSTLFQPALWAEAGLCVSVERWRPAVIIGGGVQWSVFLRDGVSLTAAQPLLRVLIEARYLVGTTHGLRVGVGAHLTPQSIVLFAGPIALGAAGPAWLRLEAGYFVEW